MINIAPGDMARAKYQSIGLYAVYAGIDPLSIQSKIILRFEIVLVISVTNVLNPSWPGPWAYVVCSKDNKMGWVPCANLNKVIH